MKLIHITSFLCAAIMALHGSAIAGGKDWPTDFEAAKKEAVASKKDLFLDFTGSDWCGICIQLNDEVFKHDAFRNGVKDTFVLVELDSPKDETHLSEEIRKQNKELEKRYVILGRFPTILLCDAEGRPYASTGHEPGGPERYVEHLNELRGNKTKRDESLAAADKAEGLAKAKALVTAIESMKLEDALVENFYGNIVSQIKSTDPKDETGFSRRVASRKRLIELETALEELLDKNDMNGALALTDKTLKESVFETGETQQVLITRAFLYAQQKKFDEALKALDEAKALAPDSPLIPDIEDLRKRVEAAMKKTEETKAVPAAE
jgi:thioredoxin-related protein